MELEESGFHHSVPGDFHDRLATDERTDHLLDLAMTRLTAAGLPGRPGSAAHRLDLGARW